MTYERVIPRDLFNESKVLKCWGRIALLIHDGCAPEGLTVDHDTEYESHFVIDQNPMTGDLYPLNLHLKLNGVKLNAVNPYNSKEAYPIIIEDDEEGSFEVFNDDGTWTNEFLRHCNGEKIDA